ncbi:tetratricopeptide repeat protein [Sorangium sp. So ce131]|uniref:tetratricopeptide repeat protein n=1 Tax=Sorangium sp. So ce131 TaxID=3133282 RepID=UPI003F606794
MTNPAARLPPSRGPDARGVVARFACGVAAAALWVSPAHTAQAAPPAQVGASSAAPASIAPGSPAPASAGKELGPPASPPLSAEAAAKQRRIERATALHDEARALYQRGEYRAAIAKLEAAVELDPEGKELIYNLAVIHERLGEIDEAERYYERYLEMETLPKERAEVTAVLKRLQGAKRELAGAKPPPPPSPAAPRAAGRPPPRRPPVAAGNARPLPPSFFVSGVVAAGSLVLGGVFAGVALARNPGADAATGGGVSVVDLQADASAAHRYAVAADVALLVAGLSGAAALYLYLSPRAPAASATTSRLLSAAWRAPIPGHGGASPAHGARPGEPTITMSLGASGARLRVQF